MCFGTIQYIFLIVCRQYLQVVLILSQSTLLLFDVAVYWTHVLLSNSQFLFVFFDSNTNVQLASMPKAYNTRTSNK